jgi:hypothetical protein
MAETTEVEAEANADPALKLVAKTGPWTYDYDGSTVHTTWNIYVVRDSTLVTPLHNDPTVVSGISPASGIEPSGVGGGWKPDPTSWLSTAQSWYLDPSRWKVELAQGGPTEWPRTTVSHVKATTKHVPSTHVTDITTTNSSIAFHVSRVGTPVLVKVSYFPNWHANGATGPWRVTPNLMVVVPTSHDVQLTYESTSADYLGLFCTVLGLLGLIGFFAWPRLRARRGAPAPAHAAG